jgi:hypothetical protein
MLLPRWGTVGSAGPGTSAFLASTDCVVGDVSDREATAAVVELGQAVSRSVRRPLKHLAVGCLAVGSAAKRSIIRRPKPRSCERTWCGSSGRLAPDKSRLCRCPLPQDTVDAALHILRR